MNARMSDSTRTVRRWARWKHAGWLLAGLAMMFALLAIPGAAPPVADAPAAGRPFAWNRDSLWQSLEDRFLEARVAGCDGSEAGIAGQIASLTGVVAALSLGPVGPEDAGLDTLEARLFTLGPHIAACPSHLPDYVGLYSRLREAIKEQSRGWDVDDRATRNRLYRSLYGGRAAVEEALLQHPDRIPALLAGRDEPSAAPAAVVRGVTIHSGDILVSRGGYPTSALIARGNDYPGNFSHVGLVHVDEVSRAVSVIEAHIERGVAIASADEYLRDKKLRLMVLRLRADLPQVVADPLLAHRAATQALARARAERIPYDFAMDYTDPSRLFCSEVASSAYRDYGVTLWMGVSTISGAGLRRWLASFGVQHFATQEPSDLEYDPQLVVVTEWRDPEALFQDHVDNAVTDAMLEGAEQGDALTYRWYQLPLARLAKGYSWILERFGGVGPVPRGMSAEAALRNRAYAERHRRLAAEVRARALTLTDERGYRPPYWALLELARAAGTGVGPSDASDR
jgi:hypothetical protein